MFNGLPSAAPGTVLVVDREGHLVRVLAEPGDRLTAGEVRWGQIRTLYEVDVTEHLLEFQDVFPCKDDIGGFRAVVKLSCAVADPVAVVTRGIRDVARVLFPNSPRPCAGMRPVPSRALPGSGDHRPGRSATWRTARDTIQRSGSGTSISSSASTTPLRSTFASVRKPPATSPGNKTPPGWTEERPSWKLRWPGPPRLSSTNGSACNVSRSGSKLSWRTSGKNSNSPGQPRGPAASSEAPGTWKWSASNLKASGRRYRPNLKQKLELEIERAELQARHDMQVLEARLQRDQRQITQLTDLLSRGQFAALAMRLAQDPAAIGPVSAYLAEQRAADASRQLQALKLLVENDGLEGWQITDQVKTVLRQLIATWTANTGQIPATESAPEIEARTPDDPLNPAPPTSPDADDGVYPQIENLRTPEPQDPAGFGN